MRDAGQTHDLSGQAPERLNELWKRTSESEYWKFDQKRIEIKRENTENSPWKYLWSKSREQNPLYFYVMIFGHELELLVKIWEMKKLGSKNLL